MTTIAHTDFPPLGCGVTPHCELSVLTGSRPRPSGSSGPWSRSETAAGTSSCTSSLSRSSSRTIVTRKGERAWRTALVASSLTMSREVSTRLASLSASSRSSTNRAERCPKFATAAAAVGFVSVYALPVRLRSRVVGDLNIFSDHAPPLGEDDKQVAQALADVASIGLLQQRTRHRATELAEQLQHALNSRIVIEQAKGVLADHGGLDMESAYQALRTHARDHNLKMSVVAESVVRRTVLLGSLVAAPRRPLTWPAAHPPRRGRPVLATVSARPPSHTPAPVSGAQEEPA
jgi:hypothetical protein